METMKTIHETLNREISETKETLKINRRRIFTHAYYLLKNNSWMSWSECLKESWKKAKEFKTKQINKLNNAVNRLANAYLPMLKTDTKLMYKNMESACLINNKFYR